MEGAVASPKTWSIFAEAFPSEADRGWTVFDGEASALTQTEGAGTFASLSKMALAEAVQTKGWDASLWTAM